MGRNLVKTGLKCPRLPRCRRIEQRIAPEHLAYEVLQSGTRRPMSLARARPGEMPGNGLWPAAGIGRKRKFEAEPDTGPSASIIGSINGCCRRASRTGTPGHQQALPNGSFGAGNLEPEPLVASDFIDFVLFICLLWPAIEHALFGGCCTSCRNGGTCHTFAACQHRLIARPRPSRGLRMLLEPAGPDLCTAGARKTALRPTRARGLATLLALAQQCELHDPIRRSSALRPWHWCKMPVYAICRIRIRLKLVV